MPFLLGSEQCSQTTLCSPIAAVFRGGASFCGSLLIPTCACRSIREWHKLQQTMCLSFALSPRRNESSNYATMESKSPKWPRQAPTDGQIYKLSAAISQNARVQA